MATKRLSSKSAKFRHDSDPLNLDARIPVDDTILGATNSIQAEKPKLVFSANGTLVLQKPKLKVVHSNSAGNLQALDEKQKPRLSSSLERDKSKSKTGNDVEEGSPRTRHSSERERDRPKLKRSLSGTAATRPPGLREVESYMSRQNTQENGDKIEKSEKAEKMEKSEKISSARSRGKSRSLKLKKQLSKEHDGDQPEQAKSVEKSGGPLKSPGSRRSKTPGPDLTDRSRKPEKGILKPSGRSKSSDSTYNDDVPNDKPIHREQSNSYITSFGTKHGQREEPPEPDKSHLQSLARGRPKSRIDSNEKEEPKSRDDSPSDYESAARQIRRVHKELKGKEAKSFQELKAYNMTSKEERDEIDRIQEEIAKKLAEEKYMKELQNCSYLRRGPVEELSVEDVFAKD